MTNEKETIFDIFHGPNKTHLSQALFNRGPYSVGFVLKGNEACINIDVQIDSITRMDGSGERFTIRGIVVNEHTTQSSLNNARVKISLCTLTDSGMFQFLNED